MAAWGVAVMEKSPALIVSKKTADVLARRYPIAAIDGGQADGSRSLKKETVIFVVRATKRQWVLELRGAIIKVNVPGLIPAPYKKLLIAAISVTGWFRSPGLGVAPRLMEIGVGVMTSVSEAGAREKIAGSR